MCTICTLYVHYMCTICTLYVHYVYTTLNKPQYHKSTITLAIMQSHLRHLHKAAEVIQQRWRGFLGRQAYGNFVLVSVYGMCSRSISISSSSSRIYQCFVRGILWQLLPYYSFLPDTFKLLPKKTLFIINYIRILFSIYIILYI